MNHSEPDRDGPLRIVVWSTAAAILIGALLRIVRLDADPYYYAWIGYITDEGRWVETARSIVLHGDLSTYGFNVQFWVAPLFQLAHVPVFALFGVSFWSSRLLTAMAGIGLLAWPTLRLRGAVTPLALFLGTALLAAQADLVMLSRVAVPETVAMLAQTVVFVVLVLGVDRRGQIVSAAVLTLVTLSIKVTLIPMVIAFALMVFVLPRSRDSGRPTWPRLVDTALYLLVIAMPGLLIVAWALLFGKVAWLDQLSTMPTFDSLLGSAAVRAIVGYPFQAELAPVFNVFALAAWLGALVWWTPVRSSVGIVPQRLFSGAVVWLLGWFIPMFLLGYFPHRYQVHGLVPMALMAVFSAEAVGTAGIGQVRESLSGRGGLSRAAAAMIAALPVGAIAAPVTVALTSAIGADPARVRWRLVATLLSSLILATAAWSLPRARVLWNFLLTYPLAFAGCWTLAAGVGLGGPYWSVSGDPAVTRSWILVSLTAAGVWVAALALARLSRGSFSRLVTLTIGFVFLIASAASIVPGYIHPTYSIRDASRQLGQMLDGTGVVTSIACESLFLENTLPYRAHFRFDSVADRSRYVVFFDAQLHRGAVRRTVYRSYSPVHVLRLHVSPEYSRRHPNRDGSTDPFATIVVSRLNDEE